MCSMAVQPGYIQIDIDFLSLSPGIDGLLFDRRGESELLASPCHWSICILPYLGLSLNTVSL